MAATPAADLAAIVATNLGGVLLCARGAIARMLEQPGGGKVFLMEGSGRWVGWHALMVGGWLPACAAGRGAACLQGRRGSVHWGGCTGCREFSYLIDPFNQLRILRSRGNATPGNCAYGATKRAMGQLTDSLAAECAGTSVGVHLINPGLVATDMLLRHADNPRSGGCRS